MSTEGGWIKLWRKARENPYLQDVVQRAVFFTLLLDAEQEPAERRIKRAVVRLGRGQSLITERELAAELKLGRQQIRRAIANLKKGGLINPRTNPQTNPETNPGWTLVTICNFDRYQRTQPSANPETNPETNPTLRSKESKNQDSADLRYAFAGRIVRLSAADFDAWRKAYRRLDLEAELQCRDDWLTSERATDADRKNWFISTSNWLRTRNSQAPPPPAPRSDASNKMDSLMHAGH